MTLETFLRVFASRVIKAVAVQTHTDWSKYLEPEIQRALEDSKKITPTPPTQEK